MNNEIRLIVMDMDGTLLNPAQQLSGENRRALMDARQAGIRLAICSGRVPADCAAFALENGLPEMAILGLNGGLSQRTPLSPPYASHVLPARTAAAVGACFLESGSTFGIFAGNRIHVFPGRSQARDCDWGARWEHPNGPKLIRGGDPAALAVQGVNKMICIEDDPRILHRHRLAMSEDAAMQLTSSWINNLELMPAGVDKGTAVGELARELGIHSAQVMVIGDYDNDLSMFRYAGFAVAMGNAPDHVKAEADAVTLSNAEDGVAWAIRRWAIPQPD